MPHGGFPGLVHPRLGPTADGRSLYEALTRKRRNPVSGTFTDEFTAMFYGTKRMELDHRDSVSMLRDEEAQGAPPRVGADLDRQTIVLRRQDSEQ